MATFTAYGTNYTAIDNPLVGSLVKSNKWGGKVRCVQDKVTMTTAGDAGTLVYCGKLPKGAIPLYTIFNHNDTTSTATGVIGYATDTNALGAITALASTANQVLAPTVFNTPLTADQNVYVTTATAATTASTEWRVAIYYMFE